MPRRCSSTTACFPIVGGWTATQERHLDQSAFARTLAQIADEGADAFYRGDIARALVRDVQAKGGCLSLDDLAGYRAEMRRAAGDRPPWRPPAGPAGPDRRADAGRCAGAAGGASLRPKPAARGRPATAPSPARCTRPSTRGCGGMGDHESAAAPGCTTHFSVVDRHGNLCAVTQTLLSIFGSRVVSPSTGLLLNNGIMWFDPEPGKPNSLAPGKRCLANYCPVVGEAADGRRFAVGASGGRKILGAVLQLSLFMMDHGMDLEAAFHQPRIDLSGNQRELLADLQLPPAVLDALRAEFTLSHDAPPGVPVCLRLPVRRAARRRPEQRLHRGDVALGRRGGRAAGRLTRRE